MYSQLYFGKEFEKLSYKDIEEFFIDKKEESDKIEFKSYVEGNAKSFVDNQNNIIKAICGMLNSEGGIIIWGAPKGVKDEKTKIQEFKGELTPMTTEIDKDSFSRRITDLINQTPRTVRLRILKKDELDQFLCIIEVGKSEYSPHQYDNIYWMRIDGQTKAAPHHYVEALFKKITYPKLEGHLKIDTVKEMIGGLMITVKIFIFNQSKHQNEEKLYVRIHMPSGSVHNQVSTEIRQVDPKNEMVSYYPKDVLYYNAYKTDKESFFISNEKLKLNKNIQELMLYFAGRHTPLLVSRYKLDLSTFLDNPNDYVAYKEVNRLISDIFGEEVSNEDFVKTIIEKY
jgi:hypothetical protein